MALFVLLGVLREFPAAGYIRTPRRKPLCGLDQNKKLLISGLGTRRVHFESIDGHEL
jgi:hypothetical protein